MEEKGIVYGRFQIPHLKHMEYILAAKMRCQVLYIGITFPDDMYVSDEESANYRIKKQANPLTYLERMEMLKDAILDFKVPRNEFEIVPFPIERPEYISQYIPKDGICYMSICDEWTAKNERLFQHLGLKTETLWKRTEGNKGVTGSQVRKLIQEKNEEWKNLVPRTVCEYVMEHGIDERIRKMK